MALTENGSNMDLKRILTRIDRMTLKESVDPDVDELISQYQRGELDAAGLRDGIDSIMSTDHSMRQGEMGNPDMRDDMAYNRPGGDREEWDQFDADELDRQGYEESIDECGGDMPQDMPMMPGAQHDEVTMNISMNGAGSKGIKDLMDILRNIESRDSMSSTSSDMVEPSRSRPPMTRRPPADTFISSEEFGNTPRELYRDIDAVTGTGDDLHGKGGEAPKVNGGGNPLSLKAKLESMYQKVKASDPGKTARRR